MITKKQNLETELVASEDGRHTYEIRRTWAETGKKGLVFELYPTISSDRCGEMDLSTMHLMNHVKDFGWSSVRIVQLNIHESWQLLTEYHNQPETTFLSHNVIPKIMDEYPAPYPYLKILGGAP